MVRNLRSRKQLTILKCTGKLITPEFFGMNPELWPQVGGITPDVSFGSVRTFGYSSWPSQWLLWYKINTSAGVYSWAKLDAFVDAFAGKEIIMTLAGTPNWCSARPSEASAVAWGDAATGASAEPSESGHTDWVNFCTAVATRYAGRIKYYEIWNEPSYAATSASYYTGTPATLARLARLAYGALKTADPACIVTSPSCVGNPNLLASDQLTPFLEASDGAGGYGRDWVDAVSFHLYPKKHSLLVSAQWYTKHWSIASIAQILLPSLLEAMNDNGLADAELICSETGITNGSDYIPHFTGLNDAERRRYTIQLLCMVLLSSATKMLWWNYDHSYFGMVGANQDAVDTVVQGAWEEVRVAVQGKSIDGSITADTTSVNIEIRESTTGAALFSYSSALV